MIPLTLTVDIPDQILMGLAEGSLIRNGGVIQNTSGQVVMWLRELDQTELEPTLHSSILPHINPIAGALNFTAQNVNSDISMSGYAAVTQEFYQVPEILKIPTVASILNLGISAMGFTIIAKRLSQIEQQLEQAQTYLENIDTKVELSFYANFRAALDLAMNAFTMSQAENRRSSALNAINRFLEAEHIYADLADIDIASGGQIGADYLLTLCLAYIAEIRCYLELEEFGTAARRFQDGRKQINNRLEKYINILLTDNPLMYLHPDLKGKTDLARLANIYRWQDPSHTESSVFELLRDKLVPKHDISWSSQVNVWIKSLPASMIEQENVRKGFRRIREKGREEVIQKLPESLATMESMVETSQRFAAYELEIKAISKLGISFHEWLQLCPAESQGGRSLLYIVPEKPLNLAETLAL